MKTAAASSEITGTVQASCGCAGTVIAAGTRLHGQNPIVSVKVHVPCAAGHPERVSSGVIERFSPQDIRPGGVMWNGDAGAAAH